MEINNKFAEKRNNYDLNKIFKKCFFPVLALSLLLFFYIGEINSLAENEANTDFYKFYLSSKYFLSDKPVYWPAPDQKSPDSHCNREARKKINQADWKMLEKLAPEYRLCLHPNLNPPFFVVLTTPFALMDYPTAWWSWSLISIIAGILALLAIFKSNIINNANDVSKKLAIGIGFYAYYPTFASLSYGQVTLILFLPVTLAWLSLRSNNKLLSGFLLGLVASIKPLFGLFIVSLIFSRNWRSVATFVITCLACFLIGGLCLGFSSYLEYSKILKGVSWLATSWNGSFSGFFSRLLGGSGNQPMFNMPNVAHGLSILGTIATLGMLTFIIFEQAKINDPKQTADIVFALTLPAMLLISPLGWMYYYPLLFISLIVFWNMKSGFKNDRLYGLLMLLALAPTVGPNPLFPLSAINTPKIWFWNAGMYFYLLITMFSLTGLIAIIHIKNRNKI